MGHYSQGSLVSHLYSQFMYAELLNDSSKLSSGVQKSSITQPKSASYGPIV